MQPSAQRRRSQPERSPHADRRPVHPQDLRRMGERFADLADPDLMEDAWS